MVIYMDRRQRKTRVAIFGAFTELLSKKHFAQITVGDIIEKADVGRATFYAHFETKEFLLRELCEELFCHIFDTAEDSEHGHKHIFECDAPDSVFQHLFMHLSKNDNNILELLASENNELFFEYFKKNLNKLCESRLSEFEDKISSGLPESFRINHIASVFVETLRWWVENGMIESPETLTQYFYLAV